MKSLPRSRKATSDPPTPEEISEILHTHWGYRPSNIRRLGSRCVHLVDAPDRRVIFRANPGWDGPSEPSLIVRFVDHLSTTGAPAPRVFPTLHGDLSVPFQDYTVSVEAALPGNPLDSGRMEILESVGSALAQTHSVAESFPESPACKNPLTRGYSLGVSPTSIPGEIRRNFGFTSRIEILLNTAH